MRACGGDADCASAHCALGRCISCGDGVRDGSESDVDCGGDLCAPCAVGNACGMNRDCRSGACEKGTCIACALGFGPPRLPTGAAPLSVVAADLDGDGKPDLAFANWTDGTASV